LKKLKFKMGKHKKQTSKKRKSKKTTKAVKSSSKRRKTFKPKMSGKNVEMIQRKLFKWWAANRRWFPWRETENPYHILVSEVMLQQTQAPRVVPKYLEFIKAFPTPSKLATAPNADVLSLWQGLGYNRRAIWLKEAARQIHEVGSFPKDPKELLKLKGVGPYTSRSVLIFAFNQDLATVDTNIRRVLIHEGFASPETPQDELFKIAEILVPKGRSRDWHNALMDYASMELTAKSTGIKPSGGTQSKFKGSRRELRGHILRLFLQNGNRVEDLADQLKLKNDLVCSVISDLEKDGLLTRKGSNYFV